MYMTIFKGNNHQCRIPIEFPMPFRNTTH